MSFSTIRSIATSSLSAAQYQMSVTSSNVANADTEGYTRKTATQAAVVSSGVGTGVTITAVTSSVDKYLVKDLVTAASALGYAEATASFTTSLQSLYGTTSGDSGTSLANSLVSLESAMSALAATPESETLKAQAVQALEDVAAQLRETSSGIQGLRADGDAGIEDAVTSVNDALETIADLNDQIAATAARGGSTADLEDLRNTALQVVAAEMDVSYYVNSDNQMRIYTSGGTTLLDSSVHALSYNAASTVTADTTFAAIAVDGKDVTGQIGSGTIGALLTLRDETLVASQDELDSLASGLIATLNDTYNGGSAVPPPESLTGSATVAGADTFSATGTLRIAVSDAAGSLVSYADLDLSSYATVDEVVSALDALDGIAASLDADGHLVVAAEVAGQGVSLADLDASVGSAGAGFSASFGMNDLLTGTGAATIAVRADILAQPGTLATGGLGTDGTLTVGTVAISSGANGIAQSLSDVLGGDTTFAAAGSLAAGEESFADHAARIVSAAAGRATSAATELTSKETAQQTLADLFSSQTGVNLDEETARLSELEQQYSTAAQLLQVLNAMFDALLTAAELA
jgi:flagellar hook-associated protein 1 FlgK